MRNTQLPLFIWLLTLTMGAAAWCQTAAAQQPAAPEPGTQDAAVTDRPADETDSAKSTKEIDIDLFLRVRRDAKRSPVAMETSVTRYVTKNEKGDLVTVDLIGVVHIGEKAYYEQLNEQFQKYDSLLYELVAPEGTVIPRGGRDSGGMNPIAALQQGMQAMLGLEFQLDHIDYTVDNFVHADMTPEEFLESMANNDESFLKMAFRAIGQGMAMQNSGGMSDVELMMALFSNNREQELRKIMAQQMQNLESGLVIFEGKDGSTIINHRNRKALEIMQEQIDAGKTRLGIFYGAGHLPDMHEQLVNRYEMRRGGQFWLTAWNLK